MTSKSPSGSAVKRIRASTRTVRSGVPTAIVIGMVSMMPSDAVGFFKNSYKTWKLSSRWRSLLPGREIAGPRLSNVRRRMPCASSVARSSASTVLTAEVTALPSCAASAACNVSSMLARRRRPTISPAGTSFRPTNPPSPVGALCMGKMRREERNAAGKRVAIAVARPCRASLVSTFTERFSPRCQSPPAVYGMQA